MSEIAIRVVEISKEFRLGKREKYQTFRDTIASIVGGPFQKAAKMLRGEASDPADPIEKFWALKDVSFEVKRGEVIGIIGGNGAGKSTLLKVLSRITEPTLGFAEIHGRVASLLEVGTGFHPELTGRENIYLNGAILGMKQKEIDRKFDEIVDFSEVEKFIDTPVKHYSSGMYLRLAFAVAAHLEPEILLVDEVLAVGDAGFQKKCLGKMGAVAKQGRTVLFVSHNMGAVTQLCGTVVQLEKGKVRRIGPSAEVVNAYLATSLGTEIKSSWSRESSTTPNSEVRFESARLLSIDEQPVSGINFNKALLVEIVYEVTIPMRDLAVTFHLHDSMGNLVFESMDTDMPEWKGYVKEPDLYRAVAKVPSALLRPGRYHVSFVSFIEGVRLFESIKGVLAFDVSDVGCTLQPKRHGIVSPVLDWKVCRVKDRVKIG